MNYLNYNFFSLTANGYLKQRPGLNGISPLCLRKYSVRPLLTDTLNKSFAKCKVLELFAGDF